MMTALAYYRSWSKNADKAPTKMTHDPPAHPMVVAPRWDRRDRAPEPPQCHRFCIDAARSCRRIEW